MLQISPLKNSIAILKLIKVLNKIKFKFPVKYIPTFFYDKVSLKVNIIANHT